MDECHHYETVNSETLVECKRENHVCGKGKIFCGQPNGMGKGTGYLLAVLRLATKIATSSLASAMIPLRRLACTMFVSKRISNQ